MNTPPTAAGVDAATARKNDAVISSLHPDCPDWMTLGPTASISAIRAAAAANTIADQQREEAWSHGFNRRTFLKGGMGVGVATLATQLVTSRVAYSAAGAETNGTLVVLFLRGGMDGLSLLVPGTTADQAFLKANRADIVVNSASGIQLDERFALHPKMAPLNKLIKAGKVAAVPAVSTPQLTRSHFQAQDLLERGSDDSETTGWLDRVLTASGPGTTFRSVAVGGLLPRSMMGSSNSLAMYDVDSFKLSVGDDQHEKTTDALSSLYTGVDHPISVQAAIALEALTVMKTEVQAKSATLDASASYPKGNLGDALSSLAQLIKANVGVKVACIDVGGWDTHTGMGNITSGDMQQHIGDLAVALAAFTADLDAAAQLDKTTIVTMSEFGRRVQQNASGGTDHGHGEAVLIIGGGVNGGSHGAWKPLTQAVLDEGDGDVQGLNDYRDVLTDVVTKRLGISAGSMSSVFPGWSPTSLGIMA